MNWTSRPSKPRLTSAAGALIAAVLSAPATADGLLEVEQTVFGMDCAPCAYSVEKSLNRLQGVVTVNVRLNEGKVRLILAPGNRVTLQEIRRRILDGGFTPMDGYVRAAGKLVSRDGKLELAIAPGTTFRLQPGGPGSAHWQALIAAPAGATADITGRVAETGGDPFVLTVDKLMRLSGAPSAG